MRRALPMAVAVVAVLASGCGDTLLDHGATWAQGALQCRAEAPVWCPDRVPEGQNACFPETATACGATCEDCTTTMTSPPAGMGAACLVASGTCGYECSGGRLKCPSASGCCDAVEVAAGDEHTCAITSNGALVCWGLNNWGQVTGTITDNPVTVPFQVFPSGVTAVAAGHYHTCAVVNGAVSCWGWNDDHQTEPPAGLTSVTALAAGFYHSCAIAAGGAVRCWGGTGLDETGGGAPITAGATAISAGWNHTCALVGAGVVQCWGSDALGQLGDGNPGGSSAAPSTPALTFAAASMVSGRNHTCAASGVEGQSVLCWGEYPGPAFGLGNPQATPAAPGNGDTYNRVAGDMAAGRTHTCVLRGAIGAPAEARCFGPDNVAGQLGGQLRIDPTEAVDVANLVGATQIAAGSDHTCAIAGGGVRCWGINSSGQLGNGTTAFPGVGVVVSVSGQ